MCRGIETRNGSSSGIVSSFAVVRVRQIAVASPINRQRLRITRVICNGDLRLKGGGSSDVVVCFGQRYASASGRNLRDDCVWICGCSTSCHTTLANGCEW